MDIPRETTEPPRTVQPIRSDYQHRETSHDRWPWLHAQEQWVAPLLPAAKDRSPRYLPVSAEMEHQVAQCRSLAYRMLPRDYRYLTAGWDRWCTVLGLYKRNE